MEPVVMGLLGSLGFVVSLFTLFVVAYRRHLRASNHRQGGPPQTARRTKPVGQIIPLEPPTHWLAINSTNTGVIRDAMGLHPQVAPRWSEALDRLNEHAVFVSAPVDGWSLVVGGALPDLEHDVDELFHFLMRVSLAVGEVQFFHFNRFDQSHGWARLKCGRVIRAYAWSGSTLWNQGPMTLDEQLLGLRCQPYGDEAELAGLGEPPPGQHNGERVMSLASRWSVDLIAASEILLAQEAEKLDDNR
jgi:hypothetical protein